MRLGRSEEAQAFIRWACFSHKEGGVAGMAVIIDIRLPSPTYHLPLVGEGARRADEES